jgi:2-keto-4-pentenoate hydratase
MTGSLPLPYWANQGDMIEVALDGLGSVRLDIA